MAETKYGKYVIREPIEHDMLGTAVHVCGEPGCVGGSYPSWPGTQTMRCITEPREISPDPHTHDYDQWFWFLGPNPENFFDFDAEVEIYLGTEGEKHVINTTSLVYVPKGLIHTPLKFTKVNKPILWFQISFNPVRTAAGDSSAPPHEGRVKFSPEEAAKLRGRALKNHPPTVSGL